MTASKARFPLITRKAGKGLASKLAQGSISKRASQCLMYRKSVPQDGPHFGWTAFIEKPGSVLPVRVEDRRSTPLSIIRRGTERLKPTSPRYTIGAGIMAPILPRTHQLLLESFIGTGCYWTERAMRKRSLMVRLETHCRYSLP